MIEGDNMKSLYNEVSLFENKELPYDYGVIMAKKTIHNLFSKVTERDFNDKFVDSVLARENEKSIELKDLDQLFE